MQNIIHEAPGVAHAFRELTNAIDDRSPIEKKIKELILLGIFTAHNAIKGIDTHVRRALDEGATKDEIICAIIYALPVVGISSVTLALEKALQIIIEVKTNQS